MNNRKLRAELLRQQQRKERTEKLLQRAKQINNDSTTGDSFTHYAFTPRGKIK